MIGQQIGRYQIVAALGQGGMGHVYRARDVQLDRDVAIKMLPPALAADPIARERLRREARAAAALDHPFICKVFEVSDHDGQVLIVMELVAGETLHERIAKGPVPVDLAVAWAGEIAEALEAAHDRRIVHRDLKPGNVMATTSGHLKVMDFGLAKVLGADSAAETALDAGGAPLTERSARVGTPAYMAPEQIAGDVVDHRSDIFAFGVLLTELVTGVHPFARPTLAGTVAAVLADPPVVGHAAAPAVPSGLRAVLHRMLEKLPGARYQSMREIRADLANLRAAASATGRLSDPAASVGHLGRSLRWPMVGRDQERAELVGRLEEAIAGRGSITLIGGEPGIGKTRLTEDLLDEARRRGCFCLTGHCYEMEGAPPYMPFIEITERTARVVPAAALRNVLGEAAPEVAKLMPELRRMFDDIPSSIELPAEQQRRFFFNAYRDFVERACRANPLAVVFEDLHWADEPTLQLLMHLTQSIPSLPLLVIGTYRDVELDVTRPFARTLETMLRQRVASRLALRRLPSEGVAALLSAMSGRPAPPSLARVIYHETEGNPFFVEEVFQHLAEEGRLFDASGAWRQDLRVESLDVPEGVRLVIGRRLERLTDATRRVLTTAAVIGRTFSLRLLDALEDAAGDDVLEALEAAERAHLVSSQSGTRETRYVFAHELIRQTLAESLSLPRRQRLHAKIASAIERVYGATADGHISALAHHLYQAGATADPERTTDALVRAAELARASAAHEDALAHLDNAISLWEGESTARTADLVERRAFVLRSLGRLSEAIEAFGQAAASWTKLAAHDRAAVTVAEGAEIRMWLMDMHTADTNLTRALVELPAMSAGSRALLLYVRSLMRGTAGDVDAARASLEEADSLRQPGVSADLDLLASRARASFAWYIMSPSTSIALAREAAQAHAARGDLWQEADVTWTVPWNLYFLGRPTDAARELDSFEAKAERVGHQAARWVVRHSRAVLAAAAGDIPRAEQIARDALEIGRQAQVPWTYHSENFLARLAMWQGRTEEGLATIRRHAAEERATYWAPSSAAMLFNALTTASPDEALAQHRTSPVPLRKGGTATAGFWVSLVMVVEGLGRLGLRDDILRLAPWVEELSASELVMPGGWVAPTAVAAGIVSRYAEAWDQAEAHFRRAIHLMDTAPYEHQRGQAREWYAEMLLARGGPGDRDRARALLAEAQAIYTALGFVGLSTRLASMGDAGSS